MQNVILERMITYWGKLLSPSNQNKWCSLLYNIVYDLHKNGYLQSKWCSFVQTCLNNCGLGYIWLNNTQTNVKRLKLKAKQVLEDQYKQTLTQKLFLHPNCVSYRLSYTENSFATQKYILKLPDFLVISLCSFRMGRNFLWLINENENNKRRHVILTSSSVPPFSGIGSICSNLDTFKHGSFRVNAGRVISAAAVRCGRGRDLI
jgi:hypothetical protein